MNNKPIFYFKIIINKFAFVKKNCNIVVNLSNTNMELTINIKEINKINFIIELMQSFDYIDILNKPNLSEFTKEQQLEIDRRLVKIENNESKFYSWNEVKKEIHSQ